MITILLVEDDIHINYINKNALTREGFKVYCATTGQECIEIINTIKIDLIVLDIDLPDTDGFSLCNKIKESHNIPILFLTAMGENSDIVKGLNCGADDYITKPYSLLVLIARINARIRIHQPNLIISIGKLKLDCISYVAYYENIDMLFTKREFLLFWLLVSQKETLISRDELCEKIWDSPSIDNYNALRILISRIKGKLLDVGLPAQITTKREKGYSLHFKN